jgi:hypothetical protein
MVRNKIIRVFLGLSILISQAAPAQGLWSNFKAAPGVLMGTLSSWGASLKNYGSSALDYLKALSPKTKGAFGLGSIAIALAVAVALSRAYSSDDGDEFGDNNYDNNRSEKRKNNIVKVEEEKTKKNSEPLSLPNVTTSKEVVPLLLGKIEVENLEEYKKFLMEQLLMVAWIDKSLVESCKLDKSQKNAIKNLNNENRVKESIGKRHLQLAAQFSALANFKKVDKEYVENLLMLKDEIIKEIAVRKDKIVSKQKELQESQKKQEEQKKKKLDKSKQKKSDKINVLLDRCYTLQKQDKPTLDGIDALIQDIEKFISKEGTDKTLQQSLLNEQLKIFKQQKENLEGALANTSKQNKLPDIKQNKLLSCLFGKK